MLPSILIWGGGEAERFQKAVALAEDFLEHAVAHSPDFLLVEADKSIQIDQIRMLQQQLQLKPYNSQVKVALINRADLLTLPAQHSLLKTLEEPPANSVIILTAQTKDSLLPTLISRCRLLSLSEKLPATDPQITAAQEAMTQKILAAGPGERLLLAEKYVYNKDQAVDLCLGQLAFWRGQLRLKKDLRTATTVRLIQACLRHLKANVNPRLAVTNLLISYPKQAKI